MVEKQNVKLNLKLNKKVSVQFLKLMFTDSITNLLSLLVAYVSEQATVKMF